MPTPDPTSSPTAVAGVMRRSDRAADLLGIEITDVEPGRAVATMTVTDQMTNGLLTCHGGFLFTLADAAMAYASNCGNERSFATSASVEFMNPAPVGTELRAVCTAITAQGRSTVHDAVVSDGDGTIVAVFRGKTLTVGGPVAPKLGDVPDA